MNPPAARSLLTRLEPPLRRVLAIDAGSRCLRLALVERSFRRLRILREQMIDLQAEGLVSTEEVASHLRATIESWGRPPVAICLPQHLSTSQLIDLPPAANADARRHIEEETRRLSGVSESAIIYDFVQIESLVPDRQQYWVSLCQEGDIRDQIKHLGLEGEDICEVTTTANALVTAFGVALPGSRRSLLVHAGAQSTVVVLVLGGYAVFAASFPVGGDSFTRAIAAQLKCSAETAEDLRHRTDLLEGADAPPEFRTVVDNWLAELLRQLQDWANDHPGAAPDLKTMPMLVSGGLFAQPGFLAYLNGRSGLKFQPWLPSAPTGAVVPASGFEVAFGTALQALGRSAQPTSLLPADRRAAWRRRLTRQLVECASLVLLTVLFFVLLFGTWQQSNLARRKESLLEKVKQGLEQAQANEALTETLNNEYDELRPLLERQQQTLNTLKTLALLQETRSNRGFWYVLFSDQHTYFTQPIPLMTTNPAPGSNPPAPPRRPLVWLTNYVSAAASNSPLNKPAFIAELCIPEEPESARRTFSEVVNALKLEPQFARVDSLSDDLRRELADSRVVLTGRHFALFLELADVNWQRPASSRRKPPATNTNGMSRAATRSSRTGSEYEEPSRPIQ